MAIIDAGKIHIFLDLDGVLADFDLHAANENKRNDDGTLKYDALDREWYRSMPAFEGAREFYDAAKKLAITKFLTGPVLSSDCFSGKADWVETFTGEGKPALKKLIICASQDKHFLAAPNRILVDDREENIKDWIAAGGIGILHKGDFDETMKALQQAIAPAPGNAPRPPGFRPRP
jgi:hypothetical protein